MKDLFPGFYPYSRQQIKKLADEATIVFGASVLLDLFRISHGRNFLDLIESKILLDRIWLPYDTAWLYHNRLAGVIQDQIDEDNKASMHLTAFKESIHNNFSHPFISKELMEKFDDFVKDVESSLETDRKFLVGCLGTHEYKNRISKLFHDRIGGMYDKTQTLQIYDESKKRNESQIPPCMTFSSSQDPRIIHNRYVIWKQIQQYAKENKKSVLMVLNRITPNWFFIYKDSFIMPHQHLINEFKQETGQDVYILSAHSFLDYLLSPQEKEDPEIKKLLGQLHDKPTLGHNQQIAPLTPNHNSV